MSGEEVLRVKVKSARDARDDNYWLLAELLHRIYYDDIYKKFGYQLWPEYVEEELEMPIRKVQFLTAFYGWFVGLPPDAQRWVRVQSWEVASKMPGMIDAENWSEWRDRLAGMKGTAKIMELRPEREEEFSSDDEMSPRMRMRFVELQIEREKMCAMMAHSKVTMISIGSYEFETREQMMRVPLAELEAHCEEIGDLVDKWAELAAEVDND